MPAALWLVLAATDTSSDVINQLLLHHTDHVFLLQQIHHRTSSISSCCIIQITCSCCNRYIIGRHQSALAASYRSRVLAATDTSSDVINQLLLHHTDHVFLLQQIHHRTSSISSCCIIQITCSCCNRYIIGRHQSVPALAASYRSRVRAATDTSSDVINRCQLLLHHTNHVFLLQQIHHRTSSISSYCIIQITCSCCNRYIIGRHQSALTASYRSRVLAATDTSSDVINQLLLHHTDHVFLLQQIHHRTSSISSCCIIQITCSCCNRYIIGRHQSVPALAASYRSRVLAATDTSSDVINRCQLLLHHTDHVFLLQQIHHRTSSISSCCIIQITCSCCNRYIIGRHQSALAASYRSRVLAATDTSSDVINRCQLLLHHTDHVFLLQQIHHRTSSIGASSCCIIQITCSCCNRYIIGRHQSVPALAASYRSRVLAATDTSSDVINRCQLLLHHTDHVFVLHHTDHVFLLQQIHHRTSSIGASSCCIRQITCSCCNRQMASSCCNRQMASSCCNRQMACACCNRQLVHAADGLFLLQ